LTAIATAPPFRNTLAPHDVVSQGLDLRKDDIKATFLGLTIRQKTDEDQLRYLFDRANRHAPAVVIFEDLDSLTNETQVTRSSFLSLLDGMNNNKGILILGTSNHPEQIDPALIHRPSRFDRIWHFPVPDAQLRSQYLDHYFKAIQPDLRARLVGETHNWSYAYLNELRMISNILAVQRCEMTLSGTPLIAAHQQLAAQFTAGCKHHVEKKETNGLGFQAA
jgi:ATP-dependent 26S proteasome regulatory subunit